MPMTFPATFSLNLVNSTSPPSSSLPAPADGGLAEAVAA